MSKGKYSPTMTRDMCARPFEDFCYNADRLTPPKWTLEMKERGETFDERTHFGNYDAEGYDAYGYSAFLEDGTYVGIGQGIDRLGYTENEYLAMSDDDFNSL